MNSAAQHRCLLLLVVLVSAITLAAFSPVDHCGFTDYDDAEYRHSQP